MAEVSFLHFPSEERELEDIVTVPLYSQIYGSDSASEDRKNQVNFVMDLFHQRVEQSQIMGSDGFVVEHGNESSLGVVEGNDDVGTNCFDLDLGLGLGLGFGGGDYDDDDIFDEGFNCGGFVMSDCGDEFFVYRRENRNDDRSNNDVGIGRSSSRLGGLRLVEIDSDSEEEVEEDHDLLGIVNHGLHSEEEECFAVDNLNVDDDDDDDVSIPLCWDSFQLEDHGDGGNEFEWEEVDARVDERDVLSIPAEPIDEGSISVLPISGPEEDGVEETVRGSGNLEWEVLLNVNQLNNNLEMENVAGPYFEDHEFYSEEYEMMFGQLGEADIGFLGRPPASKQVVERLPWVVMTEEDVMNEKTLCAVCKDQIGVGEEGKQLPCSHRYHGDCILPWLGIRNTCPVCRYELPTDDSDYEQRRAQRASRVP